jgi:deoxyribonuclease-4
MLGKAKELIRGEQFHYIELTSIPNTKISPFLKCDVPYVIHIPTEKQGSNIAEREKKSFNLKIIDECTEWADKLDAKYLVLHPGFGLIDDAIEFLEGVGDKRILIENMPKVGLNDENMIGYMPGQIATLTRNKFGFCLDFGHAIKAAVSSNRQYKGVIEEFLKLNPRMFHISDGKLNNEKDEHLNIGHGDYDFEFLMDCVKKSGGKYLTLETRRTKLNSLDEDIENLERLMLYARD